MFTYLPGALRYKMSFNLKEVMVQTTDCGLLTLTVKLLSTMFFFELRNLGIHTSLMKCAGALRILSPHVPHHKRSITNNIP